LTPAVDAKTKPPRNQPKPEIDFKSPGKVRGERP
jgi:hypothetical protein